MRIAEVEAFVVTSAETFNTSKSFFGVRGGFDNHLLAYTLCDDRVDSKVNDTGSDPEGWGR
jgi:hypothetical protein